MRHILKFILFAAFLLTWNSSSADTDIVCSATSTPPIVDGLGDDSSWQGAQPITTQDAVADIDHEIHCVHTGEQIFFKVRFPDADENREHKPLVWKADKQRYVVGSLREDTVVLKWNMEPLFTDISLSAEEAYKADIWYWKSVRTDHAGFADDKVQTYSAQPLDDGTRLLSKSGRRTYLLRQGDKGRSAYKIRSPAGYESERMSGYEYRRPQGSRADVRAKGHWSDGWWTVEFARKLRTGNADDVQLALGQRYQFGISRYEVACRPAQPELQVPLFGSGEMGETLVLILDGNQTAQQ